MAKFKTKGMIALIEGVNPPTTAITQLGDSTLELGERDALFNVTTHDTSSGVHEFLDGGFKSPMSFSGEILYDPSNAVHEVIRAAHDAGTSLYFRVTLPDTGGAHYTASVRVRNCSLPLPVMGKLVINVSLEGLGSTTFVP